MLCAGPSVAFRADAITSAPSARGRAQLSGRTRTEVIPHTGARYHRGVAPQPAANPNWCPGERELCSRGTPGAAVAADSPPGSAGRASRVMRYGRWIGVESRLFGKSQRTHDHRLIA